MADGSLWEGLQQSMPAQRGLWDGLYDPGTGMPYPGNAPDYGQLSQRMGGAAQVVAPSPDTIARVGNASRRMTNGEFYGGLAQGLYEAGAMPGRAFGTVPGGPPTPEEEANWGAATALGMVGASRLPGAAPEGAVGAAGSKLIQPNELWHGISEIKLPKPVTEMSADLATRPVTENVISPEALQGGVLLPAIGDRSMASSQLTRVGEGSPLANPVELQGGHGFMPENVDRGHVWASDKGIISTMANRAQNLAEKEGAPVYLPYTAMGERSVDFSHHMSDTLAEMVKDARILSRSSDPEKATAATFNSAMKTAGADFKADPTFPGIKSPDLREYLADASGAVRNKFAKLMDTREYQAAGFPSVAEARFAVTDPRLLNEPTGAAGLSISRLNPGSTGEPSAHRTYNTVLGGEYLGGFGQSVPKEVMFPDIVNAYAQQGYHPRQFDYLMSRGRAPVFQRANDQWLEGIMKWLEGRQ